MTDEKASPPAAQAPQPPDAPKPDLSKPDLSNTAAARPPLLPKEIGGAPGPEPTRYGDWQHKGRVTDF